MHKDTQNPEISHYSLSSQSIKITNDQLASEKEKLRRLQSFGENINELQSTSNVLMSNETSLKCITNKMTVYLNVFCALLKNKIGSNVNGTFTITMKWNRLGNQNMKIQKKTIQPFKFTKSDCHRSIFSLGRRAGECVLLLHLPRKRGTTKRNKVTSNRMTSNRRTILILITISS